MISGDVHASVLDTAGSLAMDLELFEGNGTPPVLGASFDVFGGPGTFADLVDELGAWRSEAGAAPYVGKSASPRGSEPAGGGNAPLPLGVFDLQFHAPPQTQVFATAAFVVPTAGTYSIVGLAYRQVRSGGDGSYLRIFDQSGSQIAFADIDAESWTVDPNKEIPAGTLLAGEAIRFCAGPGPSSSNVGDAIEVSFEIRKVP